LGLNFCFKNFRLFILLKLWIFHNLFPFLFNKPGGEFFLFLLKFPLKNLFFNLCNSRNFSFFFLFNKNIKDLLKIIPSLTLISNRLLFIKKSLTQMFFLGKPGRKFKDKKFPFTCLLVSNLV
jgi:hypothetical protein